MIYRIIGCSCSIMNLKMKNIAANETTIEVTIVESTFCLISKDSAFIESNDKGLDE